MSYVKVYKYKQQVSYDQGETWEDTGEYAPSGDPIGYYSTLEECMAQYRTIQSGTTCVDYDKHNQDVYEVSYDNGVTWSVVSTSAGTLIEADSPDCGYVPPTPIQYRWTQSGTTCIGYDKYQNNIKEESTDGGVTWTVVTPHEYSASTLIEADSPDCGYSPVFNGKYKLTLNDTSVVSAECDSSSSVTQNEISAYSASVVSVVIGDCVTSVGNYAFRNCSGVTSCTIGSGLTSIGNNAFWRCASLPNIVIPDSVTTIGSNAFANCVSLTSIAIPDSVTTISGSAFGSCTAATSCIIGSGVTSIGDLAFWSCSNLTSITVLATTPPTIGSNVFMSTNNCPIYVPSGKVNTYKNASGWSTYASRIQAIP